MEVPQPEIEALFSERARVRAASRSWPRGPTRRPTSTTGPTQDLEGFWADAGRAADHLVAAVGQGPRVGPAVRQVVPRRCSSTSRTTASTATSSSGLGDKVAYYWEGEPGDTRTLTYADLQREVNKCANALMALGVKTGDRVGIYMPMIPELPIAMLACAKIGAPHVVVFGGFSSDALEGRMIDSEAVALITADGGWRNGKVIDLKTAADVAVANAPTIRNVLVVRRTGNEIPMHRGATTGGTTWSRRSPTQCDPVPVDSEHLLYLLHTSGTTAKPKGIMHTTGGYLTGVSTTHHYIFDIKPDDVYWCAADIGWVTGHSYIVYGPLANATTGILYEGAPAVPGARPLVVDHREVQGLDPVLRADRDPGLHEARREPGRRSTTCRPCACWDRSASRSTPRPGSGTTRTSAAGAARSSTRGGRPRPA